MEHDLMHRSARPTAEEAAAIDAAAAAQLAELATAGQKVCLRRDCGELIDAAAAKCRWCGGRQGRVGGGATSGARRRATLPITGGEQ